jgi:hypothetical protein
MILFFLLAAGDWGALAAQLHGISHVHCAFTQEKSSSLFKTALRSSGEIDVGQGPALRLVMKQPDPAVLEVKGGEATMTANGKTERLPIDRVPQVQSFLSAFSDLFLGRTDSLQRAFTLERTRTQGGELTAVLAPKDTAVFSDAEVTFSGGVAKRVVLHEAQGDVTTITLTQCVK